jgi:molybdate transport system permease protein
MSRAEAPPARRRRLPVAPGLILGAAVAVVALGLPLAGLVARAPWGSITGVVGSHQAGQALKLSLLTSLAATVLAALFGLPLAWVQARVRYPGRALVRALTTVPMVLPPVVGGIALLLAFGRRGLVGGPLESAGVHLPFHTAGAVAAELFVAMPFLVVTAEAGFRSLDPGLEEAARALGANRWRVFRAVALPVARPAIVAGLVLCWARALGEFGATITFAGSLPGKTQTLPLFVYASLEGPNPEAAIVLSLLLLAVSFGVLVALRERWLTAS